MSARRGDAHPQEAAKAYLTAAETVTSEDPRYHRRAVPYMAPTNHEIHTGTLIAEPPPPGHSRTIKIIEISQHARNELGYRIAYKITYQWLHSPTGSPAAPEGPARVTYVAVARQPDGQWLITLHAATLDPVD